MTASFKFFQRDVPVVCHYCCRTITGRYRYARTDFYSGPVHDPDCRPTAEQIKSFVLVRRNDDKPHRCPRCHNVAPYRMGINRDDYIDRRVFGQLWCADCQVRWYFGKLGDWFGRKLELDLYDDGSL